MIIYTYPHKPLRKTICNHQANSPLYVGCNHRLEALRERRPPWPRQIITPILSTVKMLSPGCERLQTPLKKKKKKKVLDHYLHHDLGMLPLLRCFFAHLLILQYPDHHQNLISSYLYYSGPVHKISSQSVHNFLSNVVYRQTNRQTNATENITSFAKEVIRVRSYKTANVLTEIGKVTDGRVVTAGVSVTLTVLSWSGGHEFEPHEGRTWGAWYFCPKSYLNQKCHSKTHKVNVLWSLWM